MIKNLLAFSLLQIIPIFTQAQSLNYDWGGAFDGTEIEDLKVDAVGNAYLIGDFEITGDFDPGPGTFTLNNNPSLYKSAFISRIKIHGLIK